MDFSEVLAAGYDEVFSAEGDIDITEAAAKLDAKLWRKHRDEYVEWMRNGSRARIRDRLVNLNSSQRQRARQSAVRVKFLAAAERLEQNVEPELVVSQWRVDVGDGIRRPLMDMTGSDHARAMSYYQRESHSYGLCAAFHRYLTNKVPADKPTHSQMSADEVVSLWQRVAGDDAKVPTLAEAA